MNYSLIVKSAAEQDITGFYMYNSQRTGLGQEFIMCVEAALQAIQRKPLLFAIKHENVRATLIKRFPFCIFYIVNDASVFVLAVYHTSRNPQDWQIRIE